ncbi:MAG TPA: PPA1309 family protein [Marmoricola sp.]
MNETDLQAVVRELEAHAAESGWDRPERLFALVETADLVSREPQLAEALGLEPGTEPTGLTPVEQESLPPGTHLEDVLAEIVWPSEVAGCAAVAERLVLPPEADDAIPDDPGRAQEFAASHPDRQEVRIVAAALRGGDSACALRLRSHDDDESVLTSPDLVPGLLQLLHATLDLEETGS